MIPLMLFFATCKAVVRTFVGMLKLLKEVVEKVLAASESMPLYNNIDYSMSLLSPFPFFPCLPLSSTVAVPGCWPPWMGMVRSTMYYGSCVQRNSWWSTFSLLVTQWKTASWERVVHPGARKASAGQHSVDVEGHDVRTVSPHRSSQMSSLLARTPTSSSLQKGSLFDPSHHF